MKVLFKTTTLAILLALSLDTLSCGKDSNSYEELVKKKSIRVIGPLSAEKIEAENPYLKEGRGYYIEEWLKMKNAPNDTSKIYEVFGPGGSGYMLFHNGCSSAFYPTGVS